MEITVLSRPEELAKKLLEDMDEDICNGGDANCPTCGHNGATVRRVTEAFLSLFSVMSLDGEL